MAFFRKENGGDEEKKNIAWDNKNRQNTEKQKGDSNLGAGVCLHVYSVLLFHFPFFSFLSNFLSTFGFSHLFRTLEMKMDYTPPNGERLAL